MTNYGSDISRTLSPSDRQFKNVLFRKNRPPLDSELNLQDDIKDEDLRNYITSIMPSGFLLDPLNPMQDFQFNPLFSNLFALGNPKKSGSVYELEPVVWANVNGWMIPVSGTDISSAWTYGDSSNVIKLNPPPSSGNRIDFVFLEVWRARVNANPSTVNKPSASTIYKYGNTKFGGTNVADDFLDPTVGIATTARTQIQYRIRVFGSGTGSVDLVNYPDGLGDPSILAQGAAGSPVSSMVFANMREELGDPSLWRAGDGVVTNGLGSVDGYVFAVPICAVFRRNTLPFVAVADSGNPNHNGAFNRTPSASSYTSAKVLSQVTTASLIEITTGYGIVGSGPLTPYGYSVAFDITVAGLSGSGLDDTGLSLANTFIVIDGEIFGVSSINTATNKITVPALGRGRFGSNQTRHEIGSSISVFNTRPDGLYADQICENDVLDLRRAVAPAWDFNSLLQHNVNALISGNLHTEWKKEAVGSGDTQGPVVTEVSQLYAGGTSVPNEANPVDGPDGIRTVFSDAATLQPDVVSMLDNTAPQSGTLPLSIPAFGVTTGWEVGPDFQPAGFLNSAPLGTPQAFSNGSVMFFHIGGADGTLGARGTFRDGSTKAVRFLMPKEAWKSGYPIVDPTNGNQNPITLRFQNKRAFEPAPEDLADPSWADCHVGPMYPWKDLSFEYPFIALGGILSAGGSLMNTTRVAGANLSVATDYDPVYDQNPFSPIVLNVGPGFDFDAVPGFAFYVDSSDGFTREFTTDPSTVSKPLLRGEKTLYGLLTDNGRDKTGLSSELYVVLYGDTGVRSHNGAFRVIGAGTIGYTNNNAPDANSIVLYPLSSDYTALDLTSTKTLAVEFRTPYHNSDDVSDASAKTADLALILTDLQGSLSTGSFTVSDMLVSTSDHPWKATHLTAPNYNLSLNNTVSEKAVVNLTLLYHPGRGATARVPEEFTRFALTSINPASGSYLRGSKAVIDATFASATGMPSSETYWTPAQAQLWNRLPGLGWSAPDAPNYGGDVVGYVESDRESELFLDKGSKSLIFRPFRNRAMTLKKVSLAKNDTSSAFAASTCLLGTTVYTNVPGTPLKDSLGLFTASKYGSFPLPKEYMPRFGRQDIPYYVDLSSGSGPFLAGINHLFTDTTNVGSGVFNIIGGEDSVSSVKTLYFRTDLYTSYGQSGNFASTYNTRPYYNARKTTDIDSTQLYAPEIIANLNAVNSSDLGKGLKGIQLPPFLGPARVIGVFEKQDFMDAGGLTFLSNRWELAQGAAPNLLKTDADKQTLYILQDGAKDLTREEDCHTYILPSNAIDVSKAKNFDPDNPEFEYYDYVVECTVFGFAKGFINKNNYVLVRIHSGAGASVTPNDDITALELVDVGMTIPCAAGSNHQFYAAYNRSVYQGDVYKTNSQTDYTNRYGQLSIANQYAMRTPIESGEDNFGNVIPQIVNPKAFEVLASLDFHTTMGTGKFGGNLFAGTDLDVGYTIDNDWSAYRMPETSSSPTWRIEPRAFTEGQKTNPSRAVLDCLCFNNSSWSYTSSNINYYTKVNFRLLDGSLVSLYGSDPLLYSDLVSIVSSDDIFNVDTDSDSQILTETHSQSNVTIAFGSSVSITKTVTGAALGDAVVINPSTATAANSLIYEAHVTTTNTVVITITNPLGSPFGTVFNLDLQISVVHKLGKIEQTVLNLVDKINSHIKLYRSVRAFANGNKISLISVPTGTEGNAIEFSATSFSMNLGTFVNKEGGSVQNLINPIGAVTNNTPQIPFIPVFSSPLRGGTFEPTNAGNGTSQVNLVGMTERLPLGALLQDSDFLCENPLNDQASAVMSSPVGPRPVQSLLPLTGSGDEYSRFGGVAGDMFALSDGNNCITSFGAYTTATPSGIRKYRLFRGLGAVFNLSGTNPGGPLDWVSNSLPASSKPVLKGGVLACRAMLVRNFPETISGRPNPSNGDEIQMVVLTNGILGNGKTKDGGVTISGIISSAGYGEGYAAADRYRIDGRPMLKSFVRSTVDPSTVTLAVYPSTQRQPGE